MVTVAHLWRGWLEPGRSDAEYGLRAEVGDPVWFLTRQWQLGEFQGEDAASPVAVSMQAQHLPIAADPASPHLDPTVVPGEAIVEAEPGDWWTIGRRARLGRTAAPLIDAAEADRCRFGPMPAPYGALEGEVDGLAVFTGGALAGDPLFDEVPPSPPDRFSTSELTYSYDFTAGGTGLAVRGHRGGDVDWFSLDAVPEAEGGQAPPPPGQPRELIPTQLTFPGVSHPRWWQIEDAGTDIGSFPPDRSHLGTMLLGDLAVAHAEDWFVVPVPPELDHPVTSGVLVRLGQVEVRDSFGFTYRLQAPPASGPGAWSLFAVPGLDASDLVIWPVAVAPHPGPLLDEIVVGIDEDANLAWAIELRAEGLELLRDAGSDAALAETTRTGTRDFRYLPQTSVPDHWHPYTDAAGWRQAALADVTGAVPGYRPGPVSRMIGGPSGEGLGRGHRIAPTALPSSGLRLRRRALLARDTAGRPVLWVERSVAPITGPATSHLRWDVLVEDPREDG